MTDYIDSKDGASGPNYNPDLRDQTGGDTAYASIADARANGVTTAILRGGEVDVLNSQVAFNEVLNFVQQDDEVCWITNNVTAADAIVVTSTVTLGKLGNITLRSGVGVSGRVVVIG